MLAMPPALTPRPRSKGTDLGCGATIAGQVSSGRDLGTVPNQDRSQPVVIERPASALFADASRGLGALLGRSRSLSNPPLQQANATRVRSNVGLCRDAAGCARGSSRP